MPVVARAERDRQYRRGTPSVKHRVLQLPGRVRPSDQGPAARSTARWVEARRTEGRLAQRAGPVPGNCRARRFTPGIRQTCRVVSVLHQRAFLAGAADGEAEGEDAERQQHEDEQDERLDVGQQLREAAAAEERPAKPVQGVGDRQET